MRVYRVRDNLSGLYMTGHGKFPVFDESGEIYLSPGAAKRAIKTRRQHRDNVYLVIEECELACTGNVEHIGLIRGWNDAV